MAGRLQMAEQEVIQILAKRRGWIIDCVDNRWWTHSPQGIARHWFNEQGARAYLMLKCEGLIESKDALSPILESLTEGEADLLCDKLIDANRGPTEQTWKMLTLPAKDLAFALAEVISREEGKEK